MATRCSISLIRDDGSTLGIYCHWDGYPDGVGATLCDYFNTDELAAGLVALGDCSFVDSATCLDEVGAYHRMRGEKDQPWESVKPREYGNVAETEARRDEDYGCEYHYFRAVGGPWKRYEDGELIPAEQESK